MSDVVFDVFDLSTDPDASGGPVASFSVDLGTGATGPKGDQGIQGVQGVKGDTGSAGAAGTNGTNGTDGQDGADGQGVPVGGTTTQVLVKASDADFDTEWADQTGGGGAVDSVNGQTGVVVLAASDVGAATTAQGALADSATQPGDLGTAAAADTGDFDAAGAAASALATAEGYTDTAVSGLVPNTRTVAGHALSANVTVSKGDVGLGNVDNTGDASKSFTASQISDSTTVGRAVVVAVDAAAGRSAIGAGTSSLAIGTSSSTAKAGDYQPASTNISDATTVGKALIVATDAAAGRTAIAAAPLASPTFTGTPAAPTATGGTNTTQVATTAFVASAVSPLAPLASPTFTGHPVGVTETAGNNSTRLASTAYADGAVAKQPEVLIFALGDETTAITTGLKVTFRMPFAMTLTSVRASLTTASSSGIPAVNIKESGTTIFSTTLTIDATELTSTTAATPAVLSDTSLADDAEMTFIVDTAGTGAKGLKVTLIGTRT